MKIKVSVVIPNYNGLQYLEDCMDSLMKQDVRSFEIIVVDDASDDSGLEQVQSKYPDNGAYPRTRYLKHEKNEGFCKSVNDGIALATADYVLLLNNDTRANPSMVRELYHTIKKSPKIFSVAAKMVSLKNPEIMDDGGDYYCSLGWAFTPAKDKPAKNYEKRKRIFAACGGAAIYRKDVLTQIGCFDENHFAYLEDIDIGYRAKLHGYENVFEPRAVVQHAGSAASGSRHNDFKARLSAQNNIYLIYKNMPNWQILFNMPHFLIGFTMKIGFYVLKGMGSAYIKGLADGFALCKSKEGQKKRLDFTKIERTRLWLTEGELLLNTIRRIADL